MTNVNEMFLIRNYCKLFYFMHVSGTLLFIYFLER